MYHLTKRRILPFVLGPSLMQQPEKKRINEEIEIKVGKIKIKKKKRKKKKPK